MCCRIIELKNKEVICVRNGTRLGCVNDIEIDTCSGKIVAMIIYGRPRLFGFLGREDDIIINWDCVEVIGDDTILVSFDPPYRVTNNKNGLFNIF